MTSFFVILAYARIHLGKASELVHETFGQAQMHPENAKNELHVNFNNMDSDIHQNDSIYLCHLHLNKGPTLFCVTV